MKKLNLIGSVSLLMALLVGCTPTTGGESTPDSTPSEEESVSETEQHTHELTHHEAAAGTCIAEGTVEYYYCEGCDTYFSDVNATNVITNLSSGYGEHNYSEWNERVEPTCTEDGTLGYYHCDVCDKNYDNEGNLLESLVIANLGGHSYVFSKVTLEPTKENKGVAQFVCEVCETAAIELDILPLPTLSLSGQTLSWNEVTGADGYTLINGTQTIDLGPLTSIVLTSEMLNGDLSIQAYSYNTDAYYTHGASRVALEITSGNLQEGYNSDFEMRDVTIGKNSQWQYGPYGNFTNQDWWVISEDDGNMAAKMGLNSGYCNSASETWTIGVHKDIGAGMASSGTYTISFDYKLSEAAALSSNSRTIFSNINHPGGHYPVESLYLGGKEADTWYHAELKVTKGATAWQQLVFFHHTNVYTVPTAEDYVLIDNIQVFLGDDRTTNVDTLPDGTFTSFRTIGISETKDAGQWLFARTVYIENDGVGTGIIREADGNQALKVYSLNECASFDLNINTSAATPGLYKIKLDAKLGPNSLLNNFGLRAWSDFAQIISDTQIDITNLNKEEYTTIEIIVPINGKTNAEWFNLFFWSFATNNVSQDPENYFLLDNVEIYRLSFAG